MDNRRLSFFFPSFISSGAAHMASVNKVILVGNLGRDPESRTFPSGDQVCNVTIATTDKWKDKASGEMRESTEWHRLVFNGRLAEIAAQYLRKGAQIYVEGQIRTRKYTDKDGAEKYATDIRVDQLQMLGSRQGQGGPSGGDDDGGGYSQGSQGGGGNSYGDSGRGNSGGGSAPGNNMSRAPAAAPRAPAPAPRQAPAKSSSGFDDMDDDIPF
jgi:single-strand DNA-binding protein